MKFKTADIAQLEILKVKTGGEYTRPITLADAAFTDGVCKAGNPVAEDGTVANGATAVGILLNDVVEDNPNGTILAAFGVINEANANANAGITIDDAVKTALSLIVFA